ncbi:MAG: regulatory protein RecX [Selenomonadaceae bacterium]|nr:regulatory protein RecX [Selenomonadaceae bacterium]
MRESKTALMKATDLLAMSEQSSKSLRQKLLARKYDAAEVDAAIEKLQKYNYLNDEEFCKRQFEILYSAGKLSVRQIFVKLIQRGFDSAFVESLIPADNYEHDLNAATNALEKKFTRQTFEDAKAAYKFKSKLWQHLSSKGFSSEIISDAIEIFFSD